MFSVTFAHIVFNLVCNDAYQKSPLDWAKEEDHFHVVNYIFGTILILYCNTVLKLSYDRNPLSKVGYSSPSIETNSRPVVDVKIKYP